MDKYNWKKIGVGMAVGTAVGMVVLLFGSLAISWLIHTEKISLNGLDISTLAVQATACCIACLTAVLKGKERKLIISLATAILLLVTQLLIGVLTMEGQLEGVAPKLLINLITGAAVGLLTNKTKKRNGFTIKK